MSKQSFLRGTFILIVAGFITKLLGFINKIVVARVIGDEGVGLYMMAVPTFILAVTLTRLGLPVAISKMVAEADAVNDTKKIKKILVISLAITIVLSVVWACGLLFVTPILAKYFFTDERTIYPLLAIAPVIPIVAISSVIRGYFQGIQNMRPPAYSQVIEQVVRILLVAFFTTLLLPYGVEFAAAGAMISVIFGELASLIYLTSKFKFSKSFKLRSRIFQYVKTGRETFQSLMSISLPATGSQLIGSISYFFEPIIVAQSLAIAGILPAVATKQYGALTGFAIPLLLLPSFFTYALSTSLIPAISEAAAQRKMRTIQYRINQAIRFSFIVGGISFIITYVFAYPLMDLFYDAPQFAVYVQLMAPFFFFHYFQGPLASVLQALGFAKAAMINSLVGAVVKTAGIFLLASNPSLGIKGVALAISIGIVLVTLLHVATLMKVTSFKPDRSDLVKCSTAVFLGFVIAIPIYETFISSENLVQSSLLAIALVTLIFAMISVIIGALKKEDIKIIPFIK